MIKKYKEIGEVRPYFEFGIRGFEKVQETSYPYIHSGLKGEIFLKIYHYKNTTIVLNQECVENVKEWRSEISPGWRAKCFTIAGELEGIDQVVERLEKENINLEEI